jgi:outer membrane scaffolding protein for murein synthesis (MipA/OmpV family)
LKKAWLCPFGLALLLGPLCPAAAQGMGADDGGFHGNLSLGAALLPEYEGASSYMAAPYLEGQLSDGNYFARFEGGEFQFNLIDDSAFHAGPLIGYRLGRGDVASGAVSRLSHIRYSITTGGFLEYEHQAKDPRSGERITFSAADGSINTQTGWDLSLRAMAHRPVKFVDPGLIASLEADVDWSSNPYMQTYFGISAPQAAISGLPAFRAGSGFSSAGIAFSLDQFLSHTWSVGLRFHYARLFGDAAGSPVTAIAGARDQFFAGMVAGYVF